MRNFNTAVKRQGFRASMCLNKPMSSQQDNFVNGTSAVYVDMLYDQWKEEPNSVHSSWQAYFQNIDQGVEKPYEAPPSLGRVESKDANIDLILEALKSQGGAAAGGAVGGQSIEQAQSEAFKVMQLIRAYMQHGHLQAQTDPLNLDEAYKESEIASKQYAHPTAEMKKLIDYKFYGFTEADLDKTFYIDVPQLGGILERKKNWTLRELD